MKRCTRFASVAEARDEGRGARGEERLDALRDGVASRRRYLRRCCLSKAHRFDSKCVHTALSARQWRFLSLCIKLFRWLRHVPRPRPLSGLLLPCSLSPSLPASHLSRFQPSRPTPPHCPSRFPISSRLQPLLRLVAASGAARCVSLSRSRECFRQDVSQNLYR